MKANIKLVKNMYFWLSIITFTFKWLRVQSFQFSFLKLNAPFSQVHPLFVLTFFFKKMNKIFASKFYPFCTLSIHLAPVKYTFFNSLPWISTQKVSFVSIIAFGNFIAEARGSTQSEQELHSNLSIHPSIYHVSI